jgi:orotate phosphoribosyltransferase
VSEGPLRGEALAVAIRDAALLEGDFLLRSGRRSSYYLDKYRLGTQPGLLAALGAEIAAEVARHAPGAVRLAAPELGAVPLAAAAALASGLPFVIVRKEAKQYGTANRIEGLFEPGERVCLVEDIVTSGGAAIEAVVALREAGLVVDAAVCVVEREEGGLEELAREGVSLHPLFLASDVRPRDARAHG